MTWVRIEDTLPEDPCWDLTGAEGLALHIAALAFCNRNLTDGMVPRARAQRLLALEDPDAIIALLVRHGLWLERGTAFELVDFLTYQPSREKTLAERDAKHARQKRWLEKKRDASQGASRDESVDGAPAPPRPQGRGWSGHSSALPTGRATKSEKTASGFTINGPPLRVCEPHGLDWTACPECQQGKAS